MSNQSSQRFLQLLFNYTQLGDELKDGYVKDPFHLSDEKLEARLSAELKKISNK